MATQKREKPSILPETILTVPTLSGDELHAPDVSASIQVPLSNGDDMKQELSVNDVPSINAPILESELKNESNLSHAFWPAMDGTKEDVKESSGGNCQRSVEAAVDALFDRIEGQMEMLSEEQKLQQRPIEDILQALDQLVAPREVEISIDWDARGPINIREKTVLPSNASDVGSTLDETDGLTEDRKRCIETLLKEVDECLRVTRVALHSVSSTIIYIIPKKGRKRETVVKKGVILDSRFHYGVFQRLFLLLPPFCQKLNFHLLFVSLPLRQKGQYQSRDAQLEINFHPIGACCLFMEKE
ncbi:uncharacterized protein NPIL_35371 [Nephila pilipes]|uniref:Uncharacterized protein n=1 Tax=Nephila pilipes TaxID=299642 RepID=A0A8X6Q6A5_NEPPI|nr:uncharacterized protein NPIL_35371 [Nephila pilipes]